MRVWRVLLLLVVFGLGIPVQAQSAVWRVWLYNPSGVMTWVSSDGNARDVTLPTAQGQAYPQQVAVSRDGLMVAYMTNNESLRASRLVLFDLQTESVRADFVLTDLAANSLDRLADPAIFSENNGALALGLTALNGEWRVLALNAGSGSVLAELRSTDEAVTALALPAGADVLPVVRQFQGGDVAFELQLLDETGNRDAVADLLWNPATGALRENLDFPAAGDVLPATGEVILSGRDERFASNPALGVGRHNVLYVYNPATGRRFPFYHDGERALGQPRFIQNGERVLVPATDAGGAVVWTALERDGSPLGQLPLAAGDLRGSGDGFIYLTTTDIATLMIANTRDGLDAGHPVGQGPPGVDIQLAWAGDDTPRAVAYAPWIDLTDPVSIAQATQVTIASTATETPVALVSPPSEDAPFFVAPTPVFLPTPPAFQTSLQVGDRAVVTSAGHAAGLRTGPDDQAPAIILLYTDMFVDVLEGPEITDGYIWWRVRTRGERPHTGWAIEGAQGQAWLVAVAP